MSSQNSISADVSVRAFKITFLSVFFLGCAIYGVSLITSPPTYRSTARIEITWKGTNRVESNTALGNRQLMRNAAAEIRSWPLMSRVATALDLQARWGHKFNNDYPLSMADCVLMLNAQTDTFPLKNTRIIEISVYNGNSDESIQIANAVAETAYEHPGLISDSVQIKMLEEAKPPAELDRKSIPFAIIRALTRSAMFASLTAICAWGIAKWVLAKKAKIPPPIPEANAPTNPFQKY